LFDNPVRVFSLDELAATVRKLERERPGRAVEELSGAVFAELAIKRTQRAADLVAEAIRLGPGRVSQVPRSPARSGRPAPPKSGTGPSAQASN